MKKSFKWLAIFICLCGEVAHAGSLLQEEPHYDGYLFAYFEGRDGDSSLYEQIRFAVSADGIHWKALNGNKPVLDSREISQTGGVRDPHILRGNDGETFYMVATDMFTVKDGWGHNPGIVMLKSDKLDFYSAYATPDFTGFEKAPELMFHARHGAIDGDIVHKDGLYHFFFKGNTKDALGREFENGIKQAVGPTLQGPWTEQFTYLDAYWDSPTNVEGSSVFKLNDSDTYILMYDLYSDGRYEFQRSEDLFHFTSQPESFTKDFHPRHGSVISITREEARRLDEKWGGVPAELLSDDIRVFQSDGNPIITHKFTADPAALVVNDTLWLFTGHDIGKKNQGLTMKDWCVFSTTDLKHWTEYPVPLKVSDFSWDRTGRAYASQVIKRNGRYYWYISTDGSGIGVAVADRPEGPYEDAIGKPLVTNADCFASTHYWASIDPSVIIDDDGQAWLFWGNGQCYYAKLKENMVELDSEVKRLEFEGFEFTEAPWIHKHNGKYYLSYASGYPEKIAYAMADDIEGPYEYKGILNEIAGNSDTNHQSIVEFKGHWYFFYHNGGVQEGGSPCTRSVCVDYLFYNPDDTIRRIIMTSEGVAAAE